MIRFASRHPLAALFFLLLLCWLLFFYRLGERELASSHEARAAQNAFSMVHDGNWGLPRLLNGRIELQKPPLYYWLVALIASVCGNNVDGWAVRLPAALSAGGCVLALFFWGWYRGRLLAGFLAASILATCVHFTWLGRVGRIDMPLTFTTCLALLGFHFGAQARSQEAGRAWPWFLLGYIALGAGLLLKGPIAVVLPAITMMVTKVLDRRLGPANVSELSAVRGWSTLWWGVPLVLVVAAPWFIWANIQTHNELWRVFFWYHNVERGLGGADALQSHPWWFYGPRLVLDLLPWSISFPLAAWIFRCNGWWRTDRDARFGLVWLATMFGFLSCMRFKRADYLLPAYPGAALWLGCVLEQCLEANSAAAFSKRRGLLNPRLAGYATGLSVAGCVAGWLLFLTWIEPRQEQQRCYARLAAEIRRRTPDQVIFFRTEAHELVFRVGRPLDTILEWENLDVWASQPSIYVVMPPECARAWPQHLRTGRLEEVIRTADLAPGTADRPLVVLRSVPKPKVNLAAANAR